MNPSAPVSVPLLFFFDLGNDGVGHATALQVPAALINDILISHRNERKVWQAVVPVSATAPSVQPVHHRSRSIEAASIAGLIFGGLLIAAILLFGRQPGADATRDEVNAWLSDDGADTSAITALYLASFAVIAFLWFMAVIRRRIGDREDRFFATVFLGSGILAGAAILVGSSVLAAAAHVARSYGADAIDFGDYVPLQSIGWGVLGVHSARVAAVFILTTSTLVLRTRVLPKWLAILGYVIGTGLIITPFSIIEQTMVFPAWVILVSLVILIRHRELPGTLQTTDSPTPAEN